MPLLLGIGLAAGALGFGSGLYVANSANKLLLYGGLGLGGYLLATGKVKL